MSCKQSLEAAERFGILQIVLKTDSAQLRKAITSSSSDLYLSIAGGLFSDLRSVLLRKLSCFSVSHVPRTCNI